MNSQDTFLQLIRLGIGHYADRITGEIDWDEIEALAEWQGLSAIIVDGVEKLPDIQRPPKELLLQWIGDALQNYEYRYDTYCYTISEMAGFYNSHGLKMMVLKGYACSINWPKPDHRPCGDIDIWQFGVQKEADALLVKEKGIEIDNSHHHHSVFYWHDFMVENHYDFINIHHHKSHVALEGVFKELGADDTHYVELYGEKVYLPSPNLHVLFLLKHLMIHFSAGEITVRQILDWAFFVEKHGDEVEWKCVLRLLDEFYMRKFFDILNAICVEDLGFNPNIFPYVQFNLFLKDRVINDVLSPEFMGEEPKNLFVRVIWKIRRWKANKWKHELCYRESMLSAFWSGMCGHLLKPKSI